MDYIKRSLIKLPRSFRIWWGKCFILMLGKIGTHEFQDDIILYNELRRWVDSGGMPTTPYLRCPAEPKQGNPISHGEEN